MPDSNALTDSDKDIVRQSERTIDNLKRLYAFVFAISFAVIGTGAIEKLAPLLTGEVKGAPPSAIAWLINFEMLLVFLITASVFFHQGAKFLDIRYARHPVAKVHPFGFAWDYLTLALTMVPFFFMAHSFRPSITNGVGFIWFFVFYVVLLSLGLVLLILFQIRHCSFIRQYLFREDISQTEIIREDVLRTYWLLMNSFVLFVLLFIFAAFICSGNPCPTLGKGGVPWFLVLFGLMALARDYLDYRYAWRFLYPVKSEEAEDFDLWPVTHIRNVARSPAWTAFSYIFTFGAFVLMYKLDILSVSHWVAVCKVTG